MNPDQAKAVSDFLVNTLEMESKTTKKVIAAVPNDKGDYAPDPKCTKAMDLAWHVGEVHHFWATVAPVLL